MSIKDQGADRTVLQSAIAVYLERTKADDSAAQTQDDEVCAALARSNRHTYSLII